MDAGTYVTPTLRLVRPLGKGAMGSVWVAHHLRLETEVAIKFVSEPLARDSQFVERFRREAMAAARIKGPNVAQVFDHGVTKEGISFTVMELLEGEDLRTRIARQGRIDPSELRVIVHHVAKALTRAHHLGIVHRDIKPDNIFLTESDGELLVKVLDFGVAKVGVDDVTMTATGAIMGTPLYMSPEQFLSTKNVDFRTDLWSLGAVAYRALTGHLPFPGETMAAVTLAVHTAPVPRACAVRTDLPPDIDAWFAKALCREPAGRFASAKQMAEALDQVMRGSRASLPSLSPMEGASGTVRLEKIALPTSTSLNGVAATRARTEPDTTRAGAHRRNAWILATTAALITLGAVMIGLHSWLVSIASSPAPAIHTAERSQPALVPSMQIATAPSAEASPHASASETAPRAELPGSQLLPQAAVPLSATAGSPPILGGQIAKPGSRAPAGPARSSAPPNASASAAAPATASSAAEALTVAPFPPASSQASPTSPAPSPAKPASSPRPVPTMPFHPDGI
ncbi:protein kinase [Sorangium sp. So ce1014]|uniref:serine/threonine-protein kinase n=1 Tax=Sorangium sp. So ce1014 TaxID=3133326 RepID=UPI003F5F1C28